MLWAVVDSKLLTSSDQIRHLIKCRHISTQRREKLGVYNMLSGFVDLALKGLCLCNSFINIDCPQLESSPHCAGITWPSGI